MDRSGSASGEVRVEIVRLIGDAEVRGLIHRLTVGVGCVNRQALCVDVLGGHRAAVVVRVRGIHCRIHSAFASRGPALQLYQCNLISILR